MGRSFLGVVGQDSTPPGMSFDTPPAHYRTVDPVENLRVRVIVRQVQGKDLGAAEARAREADLSTTGGAGAPGLPRADTHGGDGSELYDTTFSWQKKVFSPRCVRPGRRGSRARGFPPRGCG